MFYNNNFESICLRSIRGFGYEKEDKIFSINDKEIFNAIINLINETSENKSIIETCGHAIYIGKK